MIQSWTQKKEKIDVANCFPDRNSAAIFQIYTRQQILQEFLQNKQTDKSGIIQ